MDDGADCLMAVARHGIVEAWHADHHGRIQAAIENLRTRIP